VSLHPQKKVDNMPSQQTHKKRGRGTEKALTLKDLGDFIHLVKTQVSITMRHFLFEKATCTQIYLDPKQMHANHAFHKKLTTTWKKTTNENYNTIQRRTTLLLPKESNLEPIDLNRNEELPAFGISNQKLY